jgi:hypothetical protein
VTTEPCRYCNGTGQVPVEPCADYVNGHPCARPRVNDPAYFEEYPERRSLAIYCGFHRNARLRDAFWAAKATQ